MSSFKPALIAISVLLTTACQTTVKEDPRPNDPFYAPIVPELPVQQISNNGSIFNAQHANSLYSDAKGRRVGDIITVILRENTSATKSASTTLERESEIDFDPVVVPGGGNLNLLGTGDFQIDLNATNDFEGDASANQSNNLSGNISVTVVQVMPNNNLVVRGEKWLTLNQGDEYVRLTGIVRPADINPANEVLSTKIANARIQYSGTGSFNQTQKQGWLGKFFASAYWPF
jgi:flagellar L-ring protein precursor FlgH